MTRPRVDDFCNFLYEMFNDEGYMTRLDAIRYGQNNFALSFSEAMTVVKNIYSEFDPTPRYK